MGQCLSLFEASKWPPNKRVFMTFPISNDLSEKTKYFFWFFTMWFNFHVDQFKDCEILEYLVFISENYYLNKRCTLINFDLVLELCILYRWQAMLRLLDVEQTKNLSKTPSKKEKETIMGKNNSLEHKRQIWKCLLASLSNESKSKL